MNLVASMNVKNELDRYLPLAIQSLTKFCDEVRVQDDGSDDGSFEWLQEQERVTVKRNEGPPWSSNEGLLHQSLLDFTLEAKPTHVLAIDADELVPYGEAVRWMLDEDVQFRSFTLNMVEIWSTDPWLMRVDGEWRPHPVAILWKVPEDTSPMEWKIWGRKLAGGRVPRAVRNDQRQDRCRFLGSDILHLGWSRREERESRYDRYARLDGGKYHSNDHLESILKPDEQIGLKPYPERHQSVLPVIA